jgi:fructuronate reductase
VTRLSLATLPALASRGDLRLPAIHPADLRVGIVHLGIGAFFRAHGALYTEDCIGDGAWGICGFTQRSNVVRDQLGPQDGLYTVLERGADAGPPRVAGILREVRSASHDGLGAASRIADPQVRLVTLTVTEKGYRLGREGKLNLADPLVQADLAGMGTSGHRPQTVIGQIVAGLRLRHRHDRAGLTLLSCDNLSRNGMALRRLVMQFCSALPAGGPVAGDRLAAWINESVTFPSSVVDRIVPVTRDDDRAEAARLLGFTDAGVVVAEPFRQWVIEDSFATGRPRWEAAGAILTPDVAPYEAAKLRLLNAAHSLLAYMGALAGYETIADAVRDPVLADAAASLMALDAAPTLRVPAGFDLAAYQAAVLHRFANPALGHRTSQVAADGSLKVPARLLGTARARLAAGAEPNWVALAVAAWMIFVARRATREGRPLVVEDPMATRLAAAVAGRTSPPQIVDALLGVRDVFPEDLAANETFRSLLIDHAESLLSRRTVALRA